MATPTYSGNPDFRGYIAANAPQLLGYVGNDVNGQGATGINVAKVQHDPGLYGKSNLNDITNQVDSLYGQYAAAVNGTAGGGGSARAAAPADLSSYDQGINSYNANLNNLVPGLQNAQAGNNSQYQTTINGLNQNKAQTDQTFARNKLDNQQGYVTTKNTINTNTGNTMNSLDRLLASHGAAGQSAGDYASLLAAKNGGQERQGAATSFGKNQQALDQNYGNYTNAYNTNVTNAGLQRDEGNKQAQVQYDTQRANLLQSLASLVNQRTSAAGGHGTGASQGYVNEAQSLLHDAAVQGAPRAVAAQAPLTYTAPTLASYTANPTQVAVGGQAAPSAATDSAVPFLGLLNDRQQQQQAA